MSQQPQTLSLKFREPAIYRIVVQGFIQDDYANYLGDMYISHEIEGRTVLMGQVQDQSALLGILNTLLDLQLALILVEFSGMDKPKGSVVANSPHHSI